MIYSQRRFLTTSCSLFLRIIILVSLCSILMPFPLMAQKNDSVALFTQLRDSDEHQKIIALEKIYKEYYTAFPVQAYPYALKSLALSKKLNIRESEIKAYYFISYYYSIKGMTDSALYFCEVGLGFSKIINSKILLSNGYARLGDISRTKGEKAKAVEYLKKAIALDSNNDDRVAGCSLTLGILYGDAGCKEESVYYYLKALRIREAQHKLIDAGYLSCNLGSYYYESTTGVYGIQAYEKAISLFRRANFSKGESYAYNLMGMSYASNNDYYSALKCFRKSLAINYLDTTILRSQIAFNLTNIGDAWLKLKQPDSALHYYLKSLNFSKRDKDYIPMACTYLSLGELNTQLKNYPAAIEFLKSGLYYSRLANYRAQWEEAYQLLSECYEASGNQVQALRYLKMHNEIRDSIVTEKAHEAVANLMIKYETEKKDQQISSLNIDSRSKQKKIRIAILIIFLILIITGAGSYYIWLYYRNKLLPKVKALSFIEEKITHEKEGDNRRMRSFEKLLPPELRPFTDNQLVQTELNKDLIVQLEIMMIKDKIYLNENLTLADTAHRLDSNTSYLSRLINEHYKMNFSAYLNQYRIEEAKRMILDDQFNNLSIEGIAKNAGFRSKSTFNQVFKNSTGLTPTDFAIRNGKIRA